MESIARLCFCFCIIISFWLDNEFCSLIKYINHYLSQRYNLEFVSHQSVSLPTRKTRIYINWSYNRSQNQPLLFLVINQKVNDLGVT